MIREVKMPRRERVRPWKRVICWITLGHDWGMYWSNITRDGRPGYVDICVRCGKRREK